MSASLYNFPIEQGTSFTLSMQYKDENQNVIDLTGYCARLVWRTNTGITYSFITTDTNFTEYKFTIDGPNGHIVLKIPASTTNNYDFKSAKYDFELQSPTNHYNEGGKFTTRILYGTITIIDRNSQTDNLLDCSI
jgi:hypothetical protein